jgi:hypothetical protein
MTQLKKIVMISVSTRKVKYLKWTRNFVPEETKTTRGRDLRKPSST